MGINIVYYYLKVGIYILLVMGKKVKWDEEKKLKVVLLIELVRKLLIFLIIIILKYEILKLVGFILLLLGINIINN